MEQETAGLDILISGSLYVRSEWLVVLSDVSGLWPEPLPPPSIWSRMANSLLTLTQITREAIRSFMWQRERDYEEQFGAEGAQIGATLRVRLPSDFAVVSDLVRAHKRSMELLESWLSEEQLASLQERQTFEVVGGTSGRRYRLHQKYSFGIEILEGPDAGDLLCVVPQGASALGDILLAQKIGLETNERATLQRANKHSRERQAQYALLMGGQD